MKKRLSGFTPIEYSETFSNGRGVLFSPEMKRQIQILLWITVLLSGFSRDTMAGALDNWHVRDTNSFTGLIFANNLFVAVRGTIVTSPDGVTWTARPSGTVPLAPGIAYGNGRFVVGAGGGTNLTSTDGLNWTREPTGTPSALWDVTFGNGQFVAVGSGAALLTSPDGLNWTARDSHGISGLDVTFGDGKFLVRASATNLLSSDGVNWTPWRLPSNLNCYCAGFGNGTWVMVDINNTLWTSRDAVNWTSRGRLEIVRPSEIHYAYGTWIMAGSKILSSRNGIVWTERWSPPTAANPLFAVTAGRNTFVTAGYQRMLQSDPIVNAEVRRGNPHELILSGPLGRTCRIEFSESGAGYWQTLGTVTLSSDPYVWPIESRTAARFYRAVLLGE